ncbi:MAG: envelope stress response membrane protein PspC [Litorilituus sp.]|jgi:phage shock protein C|nr:envelope stress response membrane protein PspC [Litorilituus sp.]
MSGKKGELYRNPQGGKIAGVCAGIADYFGWETWLVRILVVSGVLFGMPFLIIGYIAAWFILDTKPCAQTHKAGNKFFRYNKQHQQRKKGEADDLDYEQVNESIKVKARVWQAGEPPKQAFHDIRRKYRTLETQLQDIEKYVTSAEFTVSREINKL